MSSINCPHCGAQLDQVGKLNKIRTCFYCSQSFLVEAQPEEKAALIQHDQMIKWRGHTYRTQGFIQLKHDEGYRTEWWVLDDKNENYWLSVDDENLFLTRDEICDSSFPSWETLQVNKQLEHQNSNYLVTEKRLLHYSSSEGLLPTKAMAKYLKYTYLTNKNAQCLILIFNQSMVQCRQGHWIDPFEIEVLT